MRERLSDYSGHSPSFDMAEAIIHAAAQNAPVPTRARCRIDACATCGDPLYEFVFEWQTPFGPYHTVCSSHNAISTAEALIRRASAVMRCIAAGERPSEFELSESLAGAGPERDRLEPIWQRPQSE